MLSETLVDVGAGDLSGLGTEFSSSNRAPTVRVGERIFLNDTKDALMLLDKVRKAGRRHTGIDVMILAEGNRFAGVNHLDPESAKGLVDGGFDSLFDSALESGAHSIVIVHAVHKSERNAGRVRVLHAVEEGLEKGIQLMDYIVVILDDDGGVISALSSIWQGNETYAQVAGMVSQSHVGAPPKMER
jgi:hypothetical protein